MSAQHCPIQPPASMLGPLEPELSALETAIPQVRYVIDQIRRATTPAQLLRMSHPLFALRDVSLRVESLVGPMPEPLRSNYQAHLRTLSFEIRRAKSIAVAERARLQGRLDCVQ